jgi:hypothetical protein
MLGKGAAGRFVLIHQQEIDSPRPQEIGTLPAGNPGQPARSVNSKPQRLDALELAHPLTAILRLRRVAAESLEFNAGVAQRRFQSSRLEERHAMSSRDQTAAERGHRLQVTRERRTEDADVFHLLK